MYFYFWFSTPSLFKWVEATFQMFVFHLILVIFQWMKWFVVVLGSLAVTVCLVCVCIRSSYEAAQEWALPVQFCHLHALPLSPAFPQDCARDGQWLNFLLFVQLHDYPLHQVCLFCIQSCDWTVIPATAGVSLLHSVLWLDSYTRYSRCVSSAFSLVIGQLYPLQQVCASAFSLVIGQLYPLQQVCASAFSLVIGQLYPLQQVCASAFSLVIGQLYPLQQVCLFCIQSCDWTVIPATTGVSFLHSVLWLDSYTRYSRFVLLHSVLWLDSYTRYSRCVSSAFSLVIGQLYPLQQVCLFCIQSCDWTVIPATTGVSFLHSVLWLDSYTRYSRCVLLHSVLWLDSYTRYSRCVLLHSVLWLDSYTRYSRCVSSAFSLVIGQLYPLQQVCASAFSLVIGQLYPLQQVCASAFSLVIGQLYPLQQVCASAFSLVIGQLYPLQQVCASAFSLVIGQLYPLQQVCLFCIQSCDWTVIPATAGVSLLHSVLWLDSYTRYSRCLFCIQSCDWTVIPATAGVSLLHSVLWLDSYTSYSRCLFCIQSCDWTVIPATAGVSLLHSVLWLDSYTCYSRCVSSAFSLVIGQLYPLQQVCLFCIQSCDWTVIPATAGVCFCIQSCDWTVIPATAGVCFCIQSCDWTVIPATAGVSLLHSVLWLDSYTRYSRCVSSAFSLVIGQLYPLQQVCLFCIQSCDWTVIPATAGVCFCIQSCDWTVIPATAGVSLLHSVLWLDSYTRYIRCVSSAFSLVIGQLYPLQQVCASAFSLVIGQLYPLQQVCLFCIQSCDWTVIPATAGVSLLHSVLWLDSYTRYSRCVSSAFSLVIGQLYPLQQVCLFCIQSCDWTVIPATSGVSLLHSVLWLDSYTRYSRCVLLHSVLWLDSYTRYSRCVSSAFSLVIGQLYPLQQVCLFCIQSCDWTVIPATAGVSLLHSVLWLDSYTRYSRCVSSAFSLVIGQLYPLQQVSLLHSVLWLDSYLITGFYLFTNLSKNI